MWFRKRQLCYSLPSGEKEKSQISLESAVFLFAGEYIAKRMLCYFGVGHPLAAVAQMSQLFEIYLFFTMLIYLPPTHTQLITLIF